MGVRLQGGYKKNTDEYDIYVYDSDWVASAVEINIGGEGFSVDWVSDVNDRFAPIVTSTATVNIVIDNSNGWLSLLNTFVSNLIGAEEGRFILQIDKNGSRWWVGAILPDLVTYEDRKPPYLFQIRATDGIGKLKDIDYNNSGTAYTGNATLAGHIFNCLDKIGVTSFHSTGALFLDNTHWVENDMQVHTVATGDITRLLDYSRLDHRLFKEQDRKGKITYRSCYYVLEEIMRGIGGRLMYSDGAYRIDQYNKLNNDDIFYYSYDNTGTIDTTPVRDTSFKKTVDTDNQRAVGNGATITFYPALKDALVYYDHFSTRNLIEGEVFDGSGGIRTYDDFDTNSGTTKILGRWRVLYAVDFSGTDTPHFVLWQIQIKVGSYYLRRTATVGTNGNVTYGPVSWSISNSYYYVAGPYRFQDNVTVDFPIPDFITPVPTTSGTLQVNFEAGAVYDLDGNVISALSYDVDFTAEGYLEALINGVIKDQTERTSFLSINDTTGNTKRQETTVVIGDGPTGNSFGHLEIYNGSTWENSAAWRVGDSGTYTAFGALLANEILSGGLAPVKRMQGAVTGDYEAHLPLVRNSERYIPLRLTFTPKDRLWAGEWWDLQIGSTLTEQTPEQELVRTRPLPVSVQTGPVASPEIRSITPGRDELLNRLIPAQVGSSGITSGATVTSIPLKTAAGGEDFIKNDVLVLVNMNTGETQEFTVSANVSATDTSISVTSVTATADFPAESFIIQKVTQAKEQLNTSLAKRLPLEDYQVDANYTNKLTLTNMDELSLQVRDDASSPTAVVTHTMALGSFTMVYQKGGDTISVKLDEVTGIEILYDDSTNGVTGITINDGIINFEGVPEYANDAAADAALSSGGIYTVTSDRTLYKIP